MIYITNDIWSIFKITEWFGGIQQLINVSAQDLDHLTAWRYSDVLDVFHFARASGSGSFPWIFAYNKAELELPSILDYY